MHMDEIRTAERAAVEKLTAHEVALAHMTTLHDFQSVVMLEVDKFLKACQGTDMPVLKPGELVKMMDLVVKYQRLIQGQTTEKIDTSIDVSKVSVEDMLKMQEILAKAAQEP